MKLGSSVNWDKLRVQNVSDGRVTFLLSFDPKNCDAELNKAAGRISRKKCNSLGEWSLHGCTLAVVVRSCDLSVKQVVDAFKGMVK